MAFEDGDPTRRGRAEAGNIGFRNEFDIRPEGARGGLTPHFKIVKRGPMGVGKPVLWSASIAAAVAVVYICRMPTPENAPSGRKSVASVVTQVDATTADVGLLQLGEVRRGSFGLSNPGAEPLVVLEAKSSCDCLQVLHLPALVGPGQTAHVSYRYVGAYPGKAETTLAVLTSGTGGAREFKVRSETKAEAGRKAPELSSLDARLFRRADLPPIGREGLWSVAQLRARQEQPGLQVIDVREPGDFVQGHLPGSLNVPGRLVRTKNFLRAQELVLVDNGADRAALLQLRAELQEAGFAKVAVLAGGLNAWRRSGGKLEGASEELVRGNGFRRWLLPPALVRTTAAEEGWTILVASAPDLARAEYFFPHSRVLVAESSAAPTKGLLPPPAGAGEGPILVVSELGERYSEVEASGWSSSPRLPFYLEGGLQGYEKHLQHLTAEQRRLAAAATNPSAGRMVLTSGQKTISGAAGTPQAPVPCATCPGSR